MNMIKSYMSLAIRSLRKNKAFSAINILGLAIGIATCCLLLMYVQHELSYDRHNELADRVVRIVFQGIVKGEKMQEATVMPPVASTLNADFEEVQNATRLRDAGRPFVAYNQKNFKDSRVAYVDPNFFEVFTLPFLSGDARSALSEPHTVVISEAMALTYFGQEDPIGKTLRMANEPTPLTVTGLMKNMPDNAHFHFDLLVSMLGLPEAKSTSWMESNFYTYLVLAEGYNYKQLEAKLPGVIDKYIGPHMQQGMGLTLAEFRKQGNDLGFVLQPLTDIHMSNEFLSTLSASGNRQYVYVFSAIALFILLIACINFMNLSTASASQRAREVGIRKVMGSSRSSLVGQFMLESLLLSALALCLAVGIMQVALPYFNNLVGLNLSMRPADNAWLYPGLLAVGLVAGLIAGSYPAFFLSSFHPIKVLKGKLVDAQRTFGLRSGLVVFQFVISITLMIGTLVVYHQLKFIQNKNLGYRKEQVVVLPDLGALGEDAPAYRERLAQDSRVKKLSVSGYVPVGDSYNNNFFLAPEGKTDELVKTLRYEIDEHYLSTLGMDLLAGRTLSGNYRHDSTSILVNEAAAKAFGFGTEAVGRTLVYTNKQGGKVYFQVIGLVKDFHFRPLHEPISPLVMTARNYEAGNIILKADAADMPALLALAQAEWTKLATTEAFNYSFLDERFAKTYEAEQKTGVVLGIFTGLTILVACLGLFGLALFMAERRIKEIGIRKVLGASVAGITSLLAKDFLKLVVIALVLASPLAYYLMNQWLANFAYHISIQWWMFALAGAAAVAIAFLTVSGQAIKAALSNPAQSLHND